MQSSQRSTDSSSSHPLNMIVSRGFTTWLKEQRVSLAFTTYQAGKLFFIGLTDESRLSVFERNFDRCMGLWTDGTTLYLSSLYQLWRFENALEPGQSYKGYDRLFIPQMSYVTGDLDIHDLTVDHSGEVIFVNTRFSCLAGVSQRYSFVPLWQPTFISQLVAEDRCHLNGLALRDGSPRYVTAISQSDSVDGWRDFRQDGGCVIDITSNEIMIAGLSMPHSPRWYRDKLWLLNSGRGEFGHLDGNGVFQPVTFCPGYLRGLAFIGDFAVLGLSQPRQNHTFSGLPLEEELRLRKTEPRCGLLVVDLHRGEITHWLRIEGVIDELYDVAVLSQIQRPMAVGFKTDEINRILTLPRT